jgi:hypothetical protein
MDKELIAAGYNQTWKIMMANGKANSQCIGIR